MSRAPGCVLSRALGCTLGRVLSLALALSAAATAVRSDPADSARAAMAALAAAGAGLVAAEDAPDRVAALTETVRAYEDGLAALRAGLRETAGAETALRAALAADSDRIGQVLSLLQTLPSQPDATLFLHPEGALGTLRAGTLLAGATPALAAEAKALRHRLDRLAALRALQASGRDQLRAGLSAVQSARTELAQAIANRRDLPSGPRPDPARLDQLTAAAKTLAGFADSLAETRSATTESAADAGFAAAKGRLALPVRGRLRHRAGAADAAGVRRPGWVIATAPGALVTTPWPATIRYRGPLLDFGETVVLEPADGVLLVLAGLGVTYGEVGTILPKGAPVGLMGGAGAPENEHFFISSAEGGGAPGQETLYMELRENKTPLDPSDWFAVTD